MAQSIFDKNSLLNKYSLLGQGSPNQQFLQQQKINQGIPPLMNPEPAQTSPTMGTVPANNTRNVKFSNTSPSKGNNLLQGVSDFTGTTFGQGFTQGLLGAGRYSPVPITFGQALSEAMSAGNELVTERGKQKSYRPMTAEEKIAYGITSGNFAIDTTSGLPVNLDDGSTNVNINQAGDNELQKLSAKSFSTKGTKYSENANTANEQNQKFDTIRNLMRTIPEDAFGAFAEEKLLLQKTFNINMDTVANLEALNIEFGNFVMGQIQKTKGAVSEREMAYFGNISPTITKTRDGLLLMIDIMEQSNNLVIAKNDHYNQWSSKWITDNPDKDTVQLLQAWELEEAKWNKENNSIKNENLKKRIDNQIISNYDGQFDRAGFYAQENQDAIRNFERQNDLAIGEAVLLEVTGDNEVKLGFYSSNKDNKNIVRTIFMKY